MTQDQGNAIIILLAAILIVVGIIGLGNSKGQR